MIKPFIKKYYLIISFVLYSISLSIVATDKDFSLKWVSLAIWISAMLIPIFVFTSLRGFKKWIHFERKEFIFLAVLAIIAIFTRFILLSSYPFASIGDELRDGGMDAMHIVDGTRENIFAYGRYDAHGLNVPLFVAPFYKIIGNSTLAFKIPAAIISIADIFLIYFLCRKYLNRKIGALAALILISLPIHLYYSRSEIVVIFTSFLTTLLFFSFFAWLKERNIKNYTFLGLIIGFSFGFHASLRTLLFLSIGLVIGITMINSFKSDSILNGFKKIGSKLAIFIIMVFVGFGPRLLFTTPDILLHTKRLPGFEASQVNLSSTDKSFTLIKNGIKNYPKSFMVYFYEPTTSHFPDHRPILPFILGMFFLIGLVLGLIGKNKYIRLICIYALVVPFTNSAITDMLNADHRLASLLPISALLTAYGIYKVIESFKEYKVFGKFMSGILLLTVVGLLINTTYYFFNSEQSSYSMTTAPGMIYRDYMVMQGINVIKSSPNLNNSKTICLTTSQFDKEYFDYLHVREHFYFLTPQKDITTQINPENYDTKELYISSTCKFNLKESNWNKYEYCKEKTKFICPPDGSKFTIYQETL